MEPVTAFFLVLLGVLNIEQKASIDEQQVVIEKMDAHLLRLSVSHSAVAAREKHNDFQQQKQIDDVVRKVLLE